MLRNIYRPEVFQGSLKRKNYFEGWYYKHVSAGQDHVYSFIPGISLNKENPHAFIQVIDGITGNTNYINYPVGRFNWEKNKLFVEVGDSVFTDSYIDLKIDHENIKVSGRVDYSNQVKYPGSLLSPGIMGWYSFIPFMECKHGIVSVNHGLKGKISINGEVIDFSGGKGYIEKDWGTSFPEAWIWMQANNFKNQATSFNFSVAKIPWIGKFFIGFIAFLYFDERFYIYSTYNKSEILRLDHNDKMISLKIKNHDSVLEVRANKNTFGDLHAPVSGDMSRRIKESVDSDVSLELFGLEGDLIYRDSSKRAGLEIIEKIFDYLQFEDQPSGK